MLPDVTTKHDLYRMAQEAVELGDLESASEFLMRAYQLAMAISHNKPTEDSVEALHRLAKFYQGLHDHNRALHYFDAATYDCCAVFGAEHARTTALCLEHGMLLTALTLLNQRTRQRVN